MIPGLVLVTACYRVVHHGCVVVDCDCGGESQTDAVTGQWSLDWVGGGPGEYIEEMTFHLSAPRSSSLRRGATLHAVMSGRWGRE